MLVMLLSEFLQLFISISGGMFEGRDSKYKKGTSHFI